MGFPFDGRVTYRGLDPAIVQVVVFAGPAPQGELRFAPAFEGAA